MLTSWCRHRLGRELGRGVRRGGGGQGGGCCVGALACTGTLLLLEQVSSCENELDSLVTSPGHLLEEICADQAWKAPSGAGLVGPDCQSLAGNCYLLCEHSTLFTCEDASFAKPHQSGSLWRAAPSSNLSSPADDHLLVPSQKCPSGMLDGGYCVSHGDAVHQRQTRP